MLEIIVEVLFFVQIPEELRFVQSPPSRITTQVHDLIYIQCEASYDELLDVAYVWKHNGELLRNNHDGTERIVSNSTPCGLYCSKLYIGIFFIDYRL